jgi:hypothetical protein
MRRFAQRPGWPGDRCRGGSSSSTTPVFSWTGAGTERPTSIQEHADDDDSGIPRGVIKTLLPDHGKGGGVIKTLVEGHKDPGPGSSWPLEVPDISPEEDSEITPATNSSQQDEDPKTMMKHQRKKQNKQSENFHSVFGEDGKPVNKDKFVLYEIGYKLAWDTDVFDGMAKYMVSHWEEFSYMCKAEAEKKVGTKPNPYGLHLGLPEAVKWWQSIASETPVPKPLTKPAPKTKIPKEKPKSAFDQSEVADFLKDY